MEAGLAVMGRMAYRRQGTEMMAVSEASTEAVQATLADTGVPLEGTSRDRTRCRREAAPVVSVEGECLAGLNRREM